MPSCQKIKRKKRSVCIGDLRDRITLEDRDLTAPLVGVDANETFTNPRSRWAMVETTRGSEIFDEVNQATDVTHRVLIRFEAGITKEIWIKLANGKRLNVLDVENLDERDEFLRLQCSDKGASGKAVADA